jgi:hypothetical protein
MTIEESPVPPAASGTVLLETVASLASAGTEKVLVDLAQTRGRRGASGACRLPNDPRGTPSYLLDKSAAF